MSSSVPTPGVCRNAERGIDERLFLREALGLGQPNAEAATGLNGQTSEAGDLRLADSKPTTAEPKPLGSAVASLKPEPAGKVTPRLATPDELSEIRSSRPSAPRRPPQVAEFLTGRRIAVAGVSRSAQEAANAVFRKLRDSGYDVVPINPLAIRVEAVECFPDLLSVPGAVDALMVVTPPSAAADLVRQAAQRGIRGVWFHRSFGQGSVSQDALRACAEANVRPIVGGCPLMFLEPMDFGHRCMHWWLARRHLVPS